MTFLVLSLSAAAAAALGVVALQVGRGDIAKLIAVLTLGSANLYVILLLTSPRAQRPSD